MIFLEIKMPIFKFEEIITMSSEKFRKAIFSLKNSELLAFFTMLQESSEKKLQAEEIEKLREFNRIFNSFSQEKEQKQFEKYGKKLPPVLLDFLEENFPRIESNLHSSMRSPGSLLTNTPFKLALSKNNQPVIEALLSVIPFDDFLEKEPSSFVELVYVDEKLFCEMVDKLVAQPMERSNKIFSQLLSACFNNYDSQKEKIQYIFDKAKNINLLMFDDPGQLSLILERCSSNIDRFKYVFLLLKMTDFNKVSKHYLSNIKNITMCCLNQYAQSMATAAIPVFDSNGSELRFGPAVSELKILTEFILSFIDAVPEHYQGSVKEALFEKNVLFAALKANDEEMVRYVLENGKNEKIGEDLWKILKNSDSFSSLKIIKDYYNDEMIINELLKHLQKDFKDNYYLYQMELIAKLPELPFKWTKAQKKHLFKILSTQADFYGGKKPLETWVAHFENSITIVEKFVHELDSKSSMKITIDDKLFGHIQNDHALKGTWLEGSYLSASFKYFNKFVKDLKAANWKIPGYSDQSRRNTLKSLEKIQSQFLRASRLDEIVSNACENEPLKRKLKKKAFVSSLSDFIVQDLLANEGGLIPGGWKGLNNTSGHAMLYELRKTKEGYQFIIHNSGDGLRYHAQLEKPSGTFYATTKVYEIPTHSLSDFQDNLKKLIETIIKPSVLPSFDDAKEAYNADKVYKDIENITREIGLREKPISPSTVEWTKGQSSGTCAWWAMRAYLKSQFKGIDMSVQELDYEVRRYALSDYYEQNARSKALNNPIVRNQIGFAAENLARDLRTLPKREDKLSHQRQQAGLALIKQVTEIEEPSTKLESKGVRKEMKAGKTQMRFEVPFETFPVAEITSHEMKEVKVPNSADLNFDQKAPITSFTKLLSHVKENFNNGYYPIVTKCIEHFYLTLPKNLMTILQDFKGQKESESLPEFIEIIRKINSIYMTSTANQSVIPFAEELMVPFTSKKLAKCVMETYYQAHSKLQQDYSHLFDKHSDSDFRNSYYFTNPDPLNNDRISDAEEFVRPLPEEKFPSIETHELEDLILLEPPKLTRHEREIPDEPFVNLIKEIICKDETVKQKILEEMKKDKEFMSLNFPGSNEDEVGADISPIESLVPGSLEPPPLVLPNVDSKYERLDNLPGLEELVPPGLEPPPLVSPELDFKDERLATPPSLEGLVPAGLEPSLSLTNFGPPPALTRTDSVLPEMPPAMFRPKVPDHLKAIMYYLQKREVLKNLPVFEPLENEIRMLINSGKVISDFKALVNGDLNNLRFKNVKDIESFYQTLYGQLPTHIYLESSRSSGQYFLAGALDFDGFSRDIYRNNYRLNESQPKMVSEIFTRTIDSWKKNSNQIQTETSQTVVTESVSLERSLLNTRVDSRTQIAATIDLAKKEFLRFENADFQLFIFQNLFQGNLLQEQLKDTPETGIQLIELIKRGLAAFSQAGRLKQPAVFMLKLSLCLELFLGRLVKTEDKYQSEFRQLSEIHQIIPNKIAYYEKLIQTSPASHHRSTLRQLYGYQILHIRNQIRLEEKITPEILRTLLISWLGYNNLEQLSQPDPFLDFQLNKAMADMANTLQLHYDALQKTDKSRLNDILNQACLKLGFSLPKKEYQWEGSFPNFTLVFSENKQAYLAFNVMSGDIYQNEIQKVALPSYIYHNPLYQAIVKDRPTEFVSVSPDKTVYEFSVKGILYRFDSKRSDSKPEGSLYKQLEVGGKKNWYEFSSRNYENLPPTLIEQGNAAWISTRLDVPKHMVIINETSQQILASIDEKGHIVEIDAKTNEKTEFYLINASTDFLKNYSALTAFEDPKFIEFWKREPKPPENGEISIRLGRYGMSFKQMVKPDGTLGDIIWDKDPRYRIKIPSDTFIPNFHHLLQLEAIPETEITPKEKTKKKKKVEDIVFIPEQQFLPTEKGEQEYYQLEFDIQSNYFKQKMSQIPRYLPFMSTMESTFNSRYLTNQEHYRTFKISSTLQLVPETVEDRVYLAYTLLAKRQPLLALDHLKKLTLPLNAYQIEWLKHIILDIPAAVGDRYQRFLAQQATIETPQFMAVRAYAATLLAQQKLKRFPVQFETNQLPASYNREYQETQEKELRGFWEDPNLCQSLSKIYLDYIKKLKKVPDDMRLTTMDERQLLRYLMHYSPSVPAHIKLRRQKIAIQSTMLEKNRLQELLKNYRPDSKDYQKIKSRLEKLQQRISRLSLVAVEHAEIKTVKENLQPVKDLIFRNSERKILNGEVKTHARIIPVDKLNVYTRGADFLLSFSSYLSTALETKRNALSRNTLQTNIQMMLKEIALKKREFPSRELSTKENLTILLGYILQYPDAFSKKRSNEIFENYLKNQFEVINKLIANHKILSVLVDVPVVMSGTLTVPEISLPESVPLNIEFKEAKREPEHPAPLEALKLKYAKIYTDEHKEILKSKDLSAALIEQKEIKQKIDELEADKKIDVNKILILEKLKDDYVGIGKNIRLQLRSKTAMLFCDQLRVDENQKIRNALSSSIQNKSTSLENLKNTIVTLANQAPIELQQKLQWELELAGQERKPLSFEMILRIFLNQDLNYYKQSTALNEGDIKNLNNLIFQYLIEATRLQQEQRLADELPKLWDATLSVEDRMAVVDKIGFLLEAKRCYDPSKEPEFLVFEYLDNKLLFEEQYQYLKGFLKQDDKGFKSEAIQLIMAGGKSKVMLPLLALKKATGSNLSIIEVPDALFQLNKADLNNIIKGKFGQELQTFYFDDSMECDVLYLKNMRNMIRDSILNRQSLLTTKESMQAFELNFIKFMRSMDTANPQDIKKAKLFTEIINIFKYQGDVIIDEIDSTLDVRKQLIYTVGGSGHIPTADLKSIIDLFGFLSKLSVKLSEEPPKIIGVQQLIQGTLTISENEWKQVLSNMAAELVYDSQEKPPASPLKGILEKICQNKSPAEVKIIKDNFMNYLLSKQKEPDYLFTSLLSNHEKDRIALYKEQLSTILPLTLKRNLQEHFGLSHDPRKSDIEREIAIPYIASNTPSEKSKFGNPLETINYTLRIQLFQPLPQNILKALVNAFKAKADEERLYYATEPKPADYKSPEQEFKELTGFQLEDIDYEIPKSFDDFYAATSNNPHVKEYCLLNHLLNHIEVHDCILASDAQNHGSQFRSVQGMTGTDWNYRCYPRHPFVEPNKTVGQGSDGQTRDHLLRDPQKSHLLSKIAGTVQEKIQSALTLFKSHRNPEILHAWIDLGAFFKGISNNVVATELANFFKDTSAFQHLKYVLFFGEDNKLYALPTGTGKGSRNPVLLEQTDPHFILEKLSAHSSEDITLDNLFTYYDQRRTTGTDIAQMPLAHAFVPIGLKTLDRDLLQGVMRLRELKSKQRPEFVIPKEVQDAHPEIRDWNVNDILRFCFNNQIERLAEDHYRSALQKMQNAIRNNLFERLISSNDPLQQSAWMDHFEKIFFKIDNRSAFDRYGLTTSKIPTEKKLDEYATILKNEWLAILREAKIADLSQDEIDGMSTELQSIVKSSLSVCQQEVEHTKAAMALYDTQVEISKEKETETEKELDIELQLRSAGGEKPLSLEKIGTLDFEEFELKEGQIVGGGGLAATPLNSFSKTEFQFDNNLFVSRNFARTYEHQRQGIDGYAKDPLFFLVEQDDKAPGHIKFLIITPEEAGHIRDQFRHQKQTSNKHYWIETVHNTVHSGKKPKIVHPHYEKSLEQIAFLGADTDILFRGLRARSWIEEQSQQKIKYLEHTLFPLHRDKVNMVASLKDKLLPKKEAEMLRRPRIARS